MCFDDDSNWRVTLPLGLQAFCYIFFPYPAEEGSNREAWVGTWDPDRVNSPQDTEIPSAISIVKVWYTTL